MAFIGVKDYSHNSAAKIGVLLVNLGTPQAPTAAAVRPYLRRFLGDPRVVETSRWKWWFILNFFVLPFRPRRTAAAYQQIWRQQGSPLLIISRRQQNALQQKLNDSLGDGKAEVKLAMSYSRPLIAEALRDLQQQNCRYLLVLPLYPQYAGSTIGSVFNDVAAELSRWRLVPHLRFISGYGDDPRYIQALAAQIAEFREQNGCADKLIFSFHGTPLKMLSDGDPYHCLCHKTARLTAQALNLSPDQWMVSFQSRFGKAVWLQPYTDTTLATLPAQGIKRVQIVSPAFSADCLETLEELAVENRDVFMAAGGSEYAYIPALNDRPAHIDFLHDLVLDAAGDWQNMLQHDRENLAAQQKNFARLREQQPAFYDPHA